MRNRDDFKKTVAIQIAQRSGYRCANPSCLRPTAGPDGERATASIGVAAHITAASAGGPRYDPNLSPQERASLENGIWLCQTCSRLIDADVPSYPVERLREWKTISEMRAYLAIRNLEIVSSRSFERLEEMLPHLVAEMREDIKKSPFTREIIVLYKMQGYNPGETPFFEYYFDTHADLLGKLKIMENYGALVNIKFNNVPRFEFTEDFAEYLLGTK